jgi:hypothetical protein
MELGASGQRRAKKKADFHKLKLWRETWCEAGESKASAKAIFRLSFRDSKDAHGEK